MSQVIDKSKLFDLIKHETWVDREIKACEDEYKQQMKLRDKQKARFDFNYTRPMFILEDTIGRQHVLYEIEKPFINMCIRDKHMVNRSLVRCSYINHSVPYITINGDRVK